MNGQTMYAQVYNHQRKGICRAYFSTTEEFRSLQIGPKVHLRVEGFIVPTKKAERMDWTNTMKAMIGEDVAVPAASQGRSELARWLNTYCEKVVPPGSCVPPQPTRELETKTKLLTPPSETDGYAKPQAENANEGPAPMRLPSVSGSAAALMELYEVELEIEGCAFGDTPIAPVRAVALARKVAKARSLLQRSIF